LCTQHVGCRRKRRGFILVWQAKSCTLYGRRGLVGNADDIPHSVEQSPLPRMARNLASVLYFLDATANGCLLWMGPGGRIKLKRYARKKWVFSYCSTVSCADAFFVAFQTKVQVIRLINLRVLENVALVTTSTK
jgi:hypothetical protein